MADNEPTIDTSFRVRSSGGGRRSREEPLSDFDGKPGGTENSASYDRIYNPEGENEQTNLLENANEIELFNLIQQRKSKQARGYAAALAAQSQVQFWHGVGKFILPEADTYMAHHDLVDHGPTDLHFDPQKYPLFDKIIADHARIPALANPDHPQYADYEGLRNNLAVLRNFIFSDSFRDGSFDPGDEMHVPRIIGIAHAIGQSLHNDSWLGRVFTPALNTHLLKVEGEGAAEIYEHLLKTQRQPGFLSGLRNFFLKMFGQPLREWDLPPLGETPFSEEGLNAPSPHYQSKARSPEAAMAAAVAASMPAPPLSTPSPPAEQDARTTAETLEQIAQALEAKTRRFKSVAEMDEPAREESVELAREILRKLRNMRFDDQEMEALLDQATPKQATDKNVGVGIGGSSDSAPSGNFAEYSDRRDNYGSQKIQDLRARRMVKQAAKITQIIEIYTTYLEQARETRPEIAETPRVQQANDAISEYIHSIKLMAAKEIPNSIASAQQIGADSTLDPSRWDELHNRATDRLMASLESGMEEVVGELDQQEMDQQQENDEVAQEAVESALVHGDQQRRKRRRRKQQTSGYGAKSQLKKHLALTADDFALKQGRFREDLEPARAAAKHSGGSPAVSPPSVESAIAGLRMDDLSAVRQLGNSLKQATETGKELQDGMEKLLTEQRAQEATNPAAPLSATQSLNSERDRTRRNNPNRRNS